MKNKFYNEKIEVLTIGGWKELDGSFYSQLRYGDITKNREVAFEKYEDIKNFFNERHISNCYYKIEKIQQGPYSLFHRGFEIGFEVIRDGGYRMGINIFQEQPEFKIRYVRQAYEWDLTFRECQKLPKEEFIQYLKDCEIPENLTNRLDK